MPMSCSQHRAHRQGDLVKPFRTILFAFLLLAPPAATAVSTRLLRYPNRFATVIPGKLYRGGFPSAAHIANLHRDFGIRTVISLTDDGSEPKYTQERRAVDKAAMQFYRFPMPGNGCGDFVKLDAAAATIDAALADANKSPVFFHCAAGKQRSNAVLAAYRIRRCGWSIDQALAELQTDHELDPVTEKVLVDHLREYAEQQSDHPGRPETQAGERPS